MSQSAPSELEVSPDQPDISALLRAMPWLAPYQGAVRFMYKAFQMALKMNLWQRILLLASLFTAGNILKSLGLGTPLSGLFGFLGELSQMAFTLLLVVFLLLRPVRVYGGIKAGVEKVQHIGRAERLSQTQDPSAQKRLEKLREQINQMPQNTPPKADTQEPDSRRMPHPYVPAPPPKVSPQASPFLSGGNKDPLFWRKGQK